MQLVIIAGGKGTRLGLTDIPKPMVEIAGKPMLEHQINLAKSYGISEVFILSGYLNEVISNYFGDGSKFGIKIHHVIEPYPLGTAGSLKLLEGKLKDRFLVFYGDVVMDFDIDSFRKFDSSKDSIGTILVHPNNHPYDSDLVEVDRNGYVVNILPKPHEEGNFYGNLVNAAVYIFSTSVLDYIESGLKTDFGKDILPKILNSGGVIRAYKSAEYIKDMGTKDRFPIIKQDFESGRVRRLNLKNPRNAIFLDRDGVINKDMDNKPLAENFELLPMVAEAIKLINESDYLSIIATNQPMIAKGFVGFGDVEYVHKKMDTLLGANNAYIDAVYYCPHHPDKGFEGEVKELKKECECRKPGIGMLLEAKKQYNINLENSWMIGDRDCDMIAGKTAGCKTILVGDTIDSSKDADFQFNTLFEAVGFIMSAGI